MVFSVRGNGLCTLELILVVLSGFGSRGTWSKTSADSSVGASVPGQTLTVTLLPQGTLVFLSRLCGNLSEFSNMPQCLFMWVSNWFSTLLKNLLQQTAESISLRTKFSHFGTFSWSNEKLFSPICSAFHLSSTEISLLKLDIDNQNSLVLLLCLEPCFLCLSKCCTSYTIEVILKNKFFIYYSK